jgi:hypothetical protein
MAEKALECKALRAFSENLLAATELTAKAALLTVLVGGNQHARLGATEPRYVRVFNRRHGLRPQARYLQRTFDLKARVAIRGLLISSRVAKRVVNAARGASDAVQRWALRLPPQLSSGTHRSNCSIRCSQHLANRTR